MQAPRSLHIKVRHEDDAYWATVDELPGVFATGDDLDELRTSLEEGIALVLAEGDQPTPAIVLGPLRPNAAAMSASAELAYA